MFQSFNLKINTGSYVVIIVSFFFLDKKGEYYLANREFIQQGSGLGLVFSDTEPVRIVTHIYFWTCIIIRPGPVHWKQWTQTSPMQQKTYRPPRTQFTSPSSQVASYPEQKLDKQNLGISHKLAKIPVVVDHFSIVHLHIC